MADDTNIYLISSNYITRQYTGTKNNVGFDYDTENQTPETATEMYFTSIVNQYNANSTKTDIPEILSKLDKQNIYHKWMNNPSNQTKNLQNEKAVASILDTDIWRGYINSTYAQYAIGGPTLEMFCKAYNDSHTGEQLNVIETNNTGYKIKKGDGDPSNSATNLKTGAKNSMVDNMLFNTNIRSYFIASPHYSFGYSNSLWGVASWGFVQQHEYTTLGIFRPLVCIKSDVHLVKNADGETYSLELD